MNMNEPLIKMTGVNSVIVDPISTIEDLAVIATKFAKLADADPTGSIAQLSIAVGDLANAVQTRAEDADDEVADVLIAAMVVATTMGVTGEGLVQALQHRLTRKSSEVVNAVIKDALASRGAFDLA